jgi:hypothetical protein
MQNEPKKQTFFHAESQRSPRPRESESLREEPPATGWGFAQTFSVVQSETRKHPPYSAGAGTRFLREASQKTGAAPGGLGEKIAKHGLTGIPFLPSQPGRPFLAGCLQAGNKWAVRGVLTFASFANFVLKFPIAI